MSDILSNEEFEELVKATAKIRLISLDEARAYLVKMGARNMSAADAEKTFAVAQ